MPRATCRSKPQGTRIIIFCSTKRMCDQLAMNLGREYRAAAIHGDKKQQERDAVLAAFKNGRCPVMVATDVAARGLDVPNVGLVVNFDFPNGVEDYVHRIGRTGRAGASGESLTFFTPQVGRTRSMSESSMRTPRPFPPSVWACTVGSACSAMPRTSGEHQGFSLSAEVFRVSPHMLVLLSRPSLHTCLSSHISTHSRTYTPASYR